MLNANLKDDRYLDKIREIYLNGIPFPHIVIDQFADSNLLNICRNEVESYDDWSTDDHQHQVCKYFSPYGGSEEQFQQSMSNLALKAPITHAILHYFSSDDMLSVLSKITGIQNLQADKKYWLGGGIHKITNGGKLSVHADFNLNWMTNKFRRINLLLYLNPEWKDEYNGHLELWHRDMSSCAGKIAPIFNRAVIFNTDRTSYHGHPTPLNTPENVARYSIALYYYTDEPPPDDENQRYVTWQNT